MTRRLRPAAVTAVIALALLLAGCQSGGSDSTNVQGGTNRAPGAPPQVTARPTATTGR